MGEGEGRGRGKGRGGGGGGGGGGRGGGEGEGEGRGGEGRGEGRESGNKVFFCLLNSLVSMKGWKNVTDLNYWQEGVKVIATSLTILHEFFGCL